MATTISTTSSDVFERRESAVRSYCRNIGTVFDSAIGSFIYDVEGREYLDFLAGAGSLNYGHNDPDLKAALIEYVERDGIAHGLDLFTVAKEAFLEAFEERVLLPRALDYRVQFTGPTGANAVEAALKLARKVTGRANVVAFTNGFHGVTLGALTVTGNGHHRMAPSLPLHGASRLPFDGYLGDGTDTAELLDRMLGDPSSGLDPPAAVILETVQGEGGLNAASPEWLRRVEALTRRSGALLIVDDVQSGCGRTGSFFSFEAAGLAPDLVVLSKSISGYGLPMALLLIRPELDQWLPGEHNGTFRGNAHAFVTGRAAIEKFWTSEHFAGEVAARSALVAERLGAIAERLPGTRVKGRGMMQGIDLGSTAWAGDVTRRCFESRMIIETSGPHDEVVKVLAPLTTPGDVLEHGLAILADAIAASSAAYR